MIAQKKYILSFFILFFAYIAIFFSYLNKLELMNIFGYRPLISVVVASYNYERFLPKTLDSILNQTYKKYEVIIVDDGSKDNSVELIKKYTKKYKNFHLYQHEGGINKGLPKTIEFAISKANGEYVAFLESDDYWREDKLEEVVSLIRKNRDAVIISNNAIPFGSIDNMQDINASKQYLLDVEKFLRSGRNVVNENIDSLFNFIPTFSAVVIKKDILQKLDFNPPIPAFLDLWIYKQILHNYPLYHSKEKTTFWRKHAQSFNSKNKQSSNYEKADVFIDELKKILSKKNIEK